MNDFKIEFKRLTEKLVLSNKYFDSGTIVKSAKKRELERLPLHRVRRESLYNIDMHIKNMLLDIKTIEPKANGKLIKEVFSMKFRVDTSAVEYFYPWKE